MTRGGIAWLRPRPGRAYVAGAPMLVAHRGGAGLAPENTLAAFRSAASEWRADMLELDVRLTRDGAVVVIHDPTLDRTTDGSGPVAEHTLDEVQGLDAGHGFRGPDGRTGWPPGEARVPTLAEVLVECSGLWINVEVKEPRVAGPCRSVIEEHGATHRVLIAAEREAWRRGARGYAGPWGASREQLQAFWLSHRLPGGGPYTPGADILQVPETDRGRRIVTPRFVREAHRRNLPVQVWTVDDPAAMRRLLSWGVDGIQTDRPDVLAGVLTEVAGRPPAPAVSRATPEGP